MMAKKFFMIAAALIIMAVCMSVTASAQTRLLSDFPSGNGVEKVYISEAMLNLGLPRKEFFKYRDMFGEVKAMEVYNCENQTLTSSVKSKIEAVLKKYHAELALESEEGEELSNIYILFDEKNKETAVGMAIINYGGKTVNIVILHGDVLLKK